MAFKDLKDSWRRKSSAPPEAEAPRPTVLVIDDDAAARDALHFVLQDKYEVLRCASATEGLEAFHDGVCVVILDVKMEVHDGFWACDELRKKQPDIPIIFYSAYQDIKDPSKVIIEHQPFDYVVKDGDLKRISTAIDTAARVYALMAENKKILARLKGQERGG
ncbi:uncharacterized protein SOCE26_003660 [Sorangium cellulosum]|uniref:Response regulatory domain-containing protein n=1 Tax=Sorangium cellulosum TaxID=56 RepID=A0A2L0EI78_SORCE|nr:response regulator [Sorangium cellulosum]AUX38984.1 uncharacterized protein SOCE26_003660 [Sorangium cellulosum]